MNTIEIKQENSLAKLKAELNMAYEHSLAKLKAELNMAYEQYDKALFGSQIRAGLNTRIKQLEDRIKELVRRTKILEA